MVPNNTCNKRKNPLNTVHKHNSTSTSKQRRKMQTQQVTKENKINKYIRMSECSQFIDIILSNNDNYDNTYQSKEFKKKITETEIE